MWTIYKLWKTNEHTILKLWTLIKNIIERTHKFPYNILFTFLMDRGRAPNGIGHLMILFILWLRYFVWNFEGWHWISTPNIVHVNWEIRILYRGHCSGALWFKSSYEHLKRSWCYRIDSRYIDGLVRERRSFSALVMELRLSCTNLSIYA